MIQYLIHVYNVEESLQISVVNFNTIVHLDHDENATFRVSLSNLVTRENLIMFLKQASLTQHFHRYVNESICKFETN